MLDDGIIIFLANYVYTYSLYTRTVSLTVHLNFKVGAYGLEAENNLLHDSRELPTVATVTGKL